MLDLYSLDHSFSEIIELAKRVVGEFYCGDIRVVSFAEKVESDFGISLRKDECGEDRLVESIKREYRLGDVTYLETLDLYITREIEPMSFGCCLVVVDFPPATEVRAKKHDTTRSLCERFEFQINGIEVVHGYADEPDLKNLRSYAVSVGSFGAEDELMCQLISDGKVPLRSAGFGVGIERLCCVSSNLPNVSFFAKENPFS